MEQVFDHITNDKGTVASYIHQSSPPLATSDTDEAYQEFNTKRVEEVVKERSNKEETKVKKAKESKLAKTEKNRRIRNYCWTSLFKTLV